MLNNSGDIDYIRAQLNKFEKNIDKEIGLDYLLDALECIRDFLKESDDEQECKIAGNLMHTYRRKVIEKAKELCFNSSPDSDLLSAIDNLIQCFVDCGFDEEPDFKAMRDKIGSLLFDATCIEDMGERLTDLDLTDVQKRRLIDLEKMYNEIRGFH